MKLQEILEQDKKDLNHAKSYLLLTIFFGWLGAHKLYQQKYLIFILYALTMGIFCLGWLNDIWQAAKNYIFLNKLYKFYSSPTFELLVHNLSNNVIEVNQLNEHIEYLKKTYINTTPLNLGHAILEDLSKFQYKRAEWNNLIDSTSTINCSSMVCKNAHSQPFKYVCKYFNIEINEKSLERFSQIFNDFSAAEEGKTLLRNERQNILNSIDSLVPDFIKENDYKRFIKRLGFDDIDISDLYFPRYKFLYVSPGGNSSIACEIKFDLENLSKFIEFLSEKIQLKQTTKWQRTLMNSKLRERIKKRDNYTCQLCGISIKDEPHLLLEIDHIKPISQGGITTEDNLQTLCWKCNRKKGAKILF